MNVLSDAQMAAMQQRLAEAGIAAPVEPSTPAAEEPIVGDGDLGIAERRMWKIYQIDPDSDSHNFAVRLEFGPTYSIGSLVAATERLIGASAVLRSVIEVSEDETPRRRTIDTTGRWVVPDEIWEWNDHTDSTAGESVSAAAERMSKAPFRLTDEPAGRVRIHRHPDGVSMILVLHHLAGDESILPPVLRTLVASGTGPDASPIGQPTGTATEHGGRSGTDVDAALAHARATWAADGIRYPLSGALPQTSPADSWFSVMGEGPGHRVAGQLADEPVAALVDYARQIGATPNALLVVVSALTVAAHSGADDFVLLVPADNRRPSETVDRVGYSGNIIPMRFTFDRDARARAAVGDAVGVVYAAMEHATVDYGSILTPLRAGGGRFPVAEVMALVKNSPLRGVPVPPGAQVSCETIFKDVVHYPLSISFEFDDADHVHLEIEHRTDVIDDGAARQIARMATDLVAALPRSQDVSLGEVLTAVRVDAEAGADTGGITRPPSRLG